MSWQAAEEPEVKPLPGCRALETVIEPRPRDIGGFEVRRVLPSAHRRSVGPFVFFDQMGPAELAPGSGIDVRPHPHIGLATVTYLFAGTIVHRDSLGSVQSIEPGAVNWMTAGRGIVHSERSDNELRKRRQNLYGIQIWVALPKRHEEANPDFTHYAAESLPLIEGDGKTMRVIAGSLSGQKSPVKTLSTLFYADTICRAGASLQNCEIGLTHSSLSVCSGRTTSSGALAQGAAKKVRDVENLTFPRGNRKQATLTDRMAALALENSASRFSISRVCAIPPASMPFISGASDRGSHWTLVQIREILALNRFR